jgi:acetyl esterase
MPLNPKFENLLKTDFDSMYSLGVAKMREWYAKSWDDFKGDGEAVGWVINQVVKTSVRETPIRIYYPKVEKDLYPVFVWIHGGGFVLGNIEVYDSICRKITNNVNCVVISIDYGLAPEHKFPGPVEECYQVIKWISDNARAGKLKIDPGRIAIGGDSVGGTLSAVICQLARERSEFTIVYQVLINACFDALGQTNPLSRVENATGYRLTVKGNEWFMSQYLNDLNEAQNPLVSPLLADNFKNLPAACIITSEYDILRDEGEDYARRLSDSGVKVCLKRYDGIIHGFFNMQATLEEARDALDLVCTNLKCNFQ